jgi:hypothetical protein
MRQTERETNGQIDKRTDFLVTWRGENPSPTRKKENDTDYQTERRKET